jgi:hypothetical protein
MSDPVPPAPAIIINIIISTTIAFALSIVHTCGKTRRKRKRKPQTSAARTVCLLLLDGAMAAADPCVDAAFSRLTAAAIPGKKSPVVCVRSC